MKEGLVSIITPCYNGGKYISQTIESVIAQTYTNWEMIIVDDGSEDNSAEIIKSFNVPQVKYVYQNNAGSAAARNNGIRRANGQYIALLDSDDIWLPNFLECQINYMKEKKAICVACSYGYIDCDSRDILKPTKVKSVITVKDMRVKNQIGCLTGLYDCSKYGKILLKEELDKQIKDKTIKEYNEHLENEKYKKMFNEQQNKLALLEKEQEEEKIKKLNLEKIAQREQMKAKKIMKRLELLREKKYDKDLINNAKLELEKEKKINEEKKLQNFLEMKKIIKDSENRIIQKKEEKLKQREQEKQFSQDLEKNDIKKQNGKNKILNKIKSVGDYQQNEQTKKFWKKCKRI